MDAYEKLADEVIVLAIKDYRKAKRKGDTRQMKEIENFFLSSRLGRFTNMDGDFLLSLADMA